MYNQTVYSYINYDQHLERQFPSLPVPSLPGLPGIPGLPGPDLGGPSGFPGLPGPNFGGPSGIPGLPGSQMPPAPTAAPPSFIPQQSTATPFAVDSGAIRLCLFRNTFIWLRDGEGFWFYPIFVGPRSVAGFRWTGWSWTIFGIDTRRIISFTCF